jgi:hypothetical protein
MAPGSAALFRRGNAAERGDLPRVRPAPVPAPDLTESVRPVPTNHRDDTPSFDEIDKRKYNPSAVFLGFTYALGGAPTLPAGNFDFGPKPPTPPDLDARARVASAKYGFPVASRRGRFGVRKNYAMVSRPPDFEPRVGRRGAGRCRGAAVGIALRRLCRP